MWSILHSAKYFNFFSGGTKKKVYQETKANLKTVFNLFRRKIHSFNDGKIPTRQVMTKVQFDNEGKCECNK